MHDAYTSMAVERDSTDTNRLIISPSNDAESKHSSSIQGNKSDSLHRSASGPIRQVKALQLNKLGPHISPMSRPSSSQKCRTVTGTFFHQSPFKLPDYKAYTAGLSTNDTRPATSASKFRSHKKDISQQIFSRDDFSISTASIAKVDQRSTNRKEPPDSSQIKVQTSFGNLLTSPMETLSSPTESTSKAAQGSLFRNLSSSRLPYKFSINDSRVQSAKTPVRKLVFTDETEKNSPVKQATNFKKLQIASPKQALHMKRADWNPLLLQKASYDEKKCPDYVWNALMRQLKEQEKELTVKKPMVASDRKLVPQRVNAEYGGIHRVWSHRLARPTSGEFASLWCSNSSQVAEIRHDSARNLFERLKKYNEKRFQTNECVHTEEDIVSGMKQTVNGSLTVRNYQANNQSHTKSVRRVRFAIDQ